ncbi:MAG: recC [Friedmanniella sp.]|nr:recC [Friedmanniella sp.]
MSLHLHRAARADDLAVGLAELLSEPLGDPFAAELVSVPTPGVERWLSQTLAHRLGTSPGREDGVCAGVLFPSPRRMLATAVSEAVDGGPQAPEDGWQPQRAVWPLLRVINGCRGEPWARLLWSSLGDRAEADGAPDPVRGGRRWSTARHLAGLFATYAAARPAMVRAWDDGHDVDAAGAALTADFAWQAELWRRLRDELDAPSPVTRLARAAEVLRQDPGRSGLPARLSVFGPTRLDPDHLVLLGALAAHRDVHLWLPHPSAALWGRLAQAPEARSTRPLRRAEDRSEEQVENRLLAYLGRDSRELQLSLANLAVPTVEHHHGRHRPDPAPTLLGQLQADLEANRAARPPAERPLLTPDDSSVRVHACHGPDRQVEVLRETLVGLLADDPTLEPRDIVVMCPDIEAYAPLIVAAFGLDTAETSAEHPGHRLRVRLADRSLRQVNPLLSVVARVVGLAESRMEASVLLDLCASPPVARRFGFGTEDLERLQDLVDRSGVRWGLDSGHRARYGMGDFGQNTWAAGLDRLLLGVTMDETDQHFIGTALPLDDVDSSDVDLVGRLAELVARVRAVTDACHEPMTVHGWVDLLRQTVELLTAVSPADAWQTGHALAELGRLADAASLDDEVTLSLPEVSALLAEAFRGRPSRANFRTGTLTMCTMLPMRSVPHRVVCLLGVDDGVFPRRRPVDGDDISAADELVGDRDPRSEDRQLLLDAVLSAQERLVVLYTGMDPRSGAPVPPAVPVGALLDALETTARTPDDTTVREHILVTHRLQPFDTDNFVPGRLGTRDLPFSFDRSALRGVQAARGHRAEPERLYSAVGLQAPPPERDVELGDLVRFFLHPVRFLIRSNAGLSLWQEEERAAEQIPAVLNGLERWKIGDRLLREHLQGHSLEVLQAAEWRRGALPPRALGQRLLNGVLDDVADLATATAPYRVGPPGRAEVLLDLGPTRLTGSVSGVHGDVLLRVGFSRVAAKHRLQAWIELLAVTASNPGRPWQAVTVGRGARSAIGPVDPAWAALVLADLVDLQRTGLADPLPFAPKTSLEYADLRFRDKSVVTLRPRLDRAWAEERDEAYERFFGVGATLDTLLAQPSVAAEERGVLGEPTRFGTLARRVFHPLLWTESIR